MREGERLLSSQVLEQWKEVVESVPSDFVCKLVSYIHNYLGQCRESITIWQIAGGEAEVQPKLLLTGGCFQATKREALNVAGVLQRVPLIRYTDNKGPQCGKLSTDNKGLVGLF